MSETRRVVIDIGANLLTVIVTDGQGELIQQLELEGPISTGEQATLDIVRDTFREAVA